MVAFACRDAPAARFRAARASSIAALLPAAEGSDVAARFLAQASGFASLDAARHGVVGGGTTSAFVAGCSPAAFGGAAVRHGTTPAALDGSAGLAFGLTLSGGGRPRRLLFVREGRVLVWRAIGGGGCRIGAWASQRPYPSRGVPGPADGYPLCRVVPVARRRTSLPTSACLRTMVSHRRRVSRQFRRASYEAVCFPGHWRVSCGSRWA